MLDDFIAALHEIASKLLEHAEAIDSQLGNGAPDQGVIGDSLESICEALGKAVALLEVPGSPLDTLVAAVGNARVSLPMATLAHYIADHRQALEKLGISKRTIEKVVAELEALANVGETALDSPQTLTREHVLDPLRQLRDWICEMAKLADIAQLLTTPAVLKMAAKGVMGAAVVVVDITGAAAAAPTDPFGWVLFKAVKSVWAGARMVRSAVAEGRTAWGRLKDAIAARTQERVQAQRQELKKKAAKDEFRLPAKPKGKPPRG
jgi:hypothetical protein